MISTIIIALLLWVLFAALTSPLESLSWWAGWYGGGSTNLIYSSMSQLQASYNHDVGVCKSQENQSPVAQHQADLYVVYLTGIGSMEPHKHPQIEAAFLQALTVRLPNAKIVTDIFPYSPNNKALTGDRIFSWFWRRMERYKTVPHLWGLLGYLPNIRNLFQIIVSADHRYGPIYNFACACLIFEGLLRHGYEVERKTPVLLLGYSGGGQMAAGAAGYLKEMIDAPISIVSLAGIVCAAPGLEGVDRFYQLYASKDMVEKIGAIIFPGRWRIMPNSSWNRLKREGHLRLKNMGPLVHEKGGSYLDDKSYFENGESYLERTIKTIASITQIEASYANRFQ